MTNFFSLFDLELVLDIKVVKLQHGLMKQRDDFVSYFEAKEILEQKKSLNKNTVQAATLGQ